MHKILRTCWKTLDLLVAIAIVAFNVIFVPILLTAIVMGMFLVSGAAEPSNLLRHLVSVLSCLGEVFGALTLMVAAVMSTQQICFNKSLKKVVLVGLISGILSALCSWLCFSPVADHIKVVLCYTILSAIAHMVELLQQKSVSKTELE
jgi:hypothetical protein